MINQYIKLIKCHFSFCFNKVSTILLLLMFTIDIIYNFLVIKGLDKSESSLSLWESYLESGFSFLTFLSIVFSIIVFSYSFLSKQDSYLSYLISPKVNKISYFLTKIISLFIFIMIFIILELLSFFLPIIITGLFQIEKDVLFNFIDVLEVMMFYGMTSLLLIMAFDNMYVAIAPIILFIFSTNITLLSEELKTVFSFIIPIFSEKYRLINGDGVVITLVLVLIFSSSVYYYYKD